MNSSTEERINQDLRYIGEIFRTGDSLLIKNPEAGDIYVDKGHVGKGGNGLQHIIEQRFEKDKRSTDEITAMLSLVMAAAESGKITRNVKVLHNEKDIGTLDIEKDGIIAFVSKTRDGRDEKFVITGFDDFTKKDEARDAIRAVIADNSYAPEFVIVKKQVVATLASAYIVHLKELKVNLEKKNVATAKKNLEKLKPYLASDELKEFFSREKPYLKSEKIAESVNMIFNHFKSIPEFSEICTQVKTIVSQNKLKSDKEVLAENHRLIEENKKLKNLLSKLKKQNKILFGKNITDDWSDRR